MGFVNTAPIIRPPQSDLLTIVQLARAGDILSILPAVDKIREGQRVNWLVHDSFASVLDSVSWVNIHRFRGGDCGVKDAIQHAERFIGGKVIATQVNGNPIPRSKDNFIVDQWHRLGMLRYFHDLPLVFDKRNADRDAVLARTHLPKTDKPILAYCMSGHSSPFPRANAFVAWLRSHAPQYQLLDIAAIKLPSVVDLLPILQKCALLVTIDSAPLHLAYACGIPTVALSQPLAWYMSEPRYHWIKRITYDQADDSSVLNELESLLSMPLEFLNSMRGKLIRDPSKAREIVHVVDWFEGSGETARRHNFARSTWEAIEKNDGHWNTFRHEIHNGQRSSRDLGDNRYLPYVRDVIDLMIERANPDDQSIIVFTNADGCLFPETPDAIRREMVNVPCVCSGRWDLPRIIKPMNLNDAHGTRVYVGTDLFAFTPAWWRSIRNTFPDMLLACEGWDFVFKEMMRFSNQRARLSYPLVYHEIHAAPWTVGRESSPAHKHNLRLGTEWAYSVGAEEYLEVPPKIFRSEPIKRGRQKMKEPTIAIPTDEDRKNHAARLRSDPTVKRLFLPFLGEFGHKIMHHIRLVHFSAGSEKIICCKRGEECLYPSATEFFYDWDDPVADENRAGTDKPREWPQIREKFVGHKAVNSAGLPLAEERLCYNPDQRIPFKIKTRGLRFDVALGLRNRKLLNEKNWPHAAKLVKWIKDSGLSCAIIGTRENSPNINGMSYSGDYGDIDAAIEIIGNAKLFFGQDSGAAHLAATVGAKMIVLDMPEHGDPDDNARGCNQPFFDRMRLVNQDHRMIRISNKRWHDPAFVFAAIQREMISEDNGAIDYIGRGSTPRITAVCLNYTANVTAGGELAQMIDTLIMRAKPERILETGTYHGTGTTRIVLDALKHYELKADFASIECNSENIKIASANLRGEPVKLIHALSIPRSRLPSRDQVERETVRHISKLAQYVDHDPSDRAEKYLSETNCADVDDDGIGSVMREWNGQCDLAILDSAGHIGKTEFNYFVSKLRTPCIIICDDAYHVKHARTLESIKLDRRFDIIAQGEERYGWFVCEFTPQASGNRLMPRKRVEV